VCIAALQPHKRIAELIDGYAKLLEAIPDYAGRLVVIGHAHDSRYAAGLHAQVARLQLQARVIFTGGVPHAVIPAYLRNALALIHPSMCESFGLPLLEAMTAGVPIACSPIPASVEVAGDAALFFDPNDPADIAAKLTQLSDPSVRRDLIARGHARLATFKSWAEVAAQTRDVLLSVVKATT
jgi:glycosyltransferase involved in cell wall biosynthesis